MPRRGRLPKPEGLKKRQGNPGKRALRKSAPLASEPIGRHPPPAYLTAEEREVWASQVAVLDSLNFVRPSDLKAFGRFVKFQALFEQLALDVRADNMVETTVSDKVTMERVNKRFLALLHIDKRLLAYDAEFGTTPSGRQALLARLAQRPMQLPLEPAPGQGARAEPGRPPAPANAPQQSPARPSPIGLGRVHH